MVSTRSAARPFNNVVGFMLAGLVGGLALATCGGEPTDDPEGITDDEIEVSTQELTSSECRAASNHGRKSVRICHYDSGKRKFSPVTVDEHGCCGHARHSNDYVAGNDTNCTGGGGSCVQANGKCDSKRKCCAGSTCTGGKCVPSPTCLGSGASCNPVSGLQCCAGLSCGALDPTKPTVFTCNP